MHARAERRKRRRLAQPVPESEAPYSVEGASTDEEQDEQTVAQHAQACEAIIAKTAQIFSDVVNDFCDVKLIAQRFERWKHKYPGTYREAYVGKSLVQILPPLVRLQVLTWNPLDVR